MRGPNYAAVGLCVVLNALTIAIGAFFIVFYFFPHKIVFVGTGVALASGAFWWVFNTFTTYGKRILGIRDLYIETILTRARDAINVSLTLFLVAALGTMVMFKTIVDRVYYLQALNRAIPFFEADQVGVPAAEDLAVAFALNPQRPEVPFILARSARLLTFDDKPDAFYVYMQQFLAKLDRKTFIDRSAKFRPQYTLAQQAPEIPTLDPIRLLAGYLIEVPPDRMEAAYDEAIALLKQYRDDTGDDAARLQRTLMEIERDLEVKPDAPNRAENIANAIGRLERETDIGKVLVTSSDAAQATSRSVAFVADHIYQQALDGLAYAKALKIIDQSQTNNGCFKSAEKDIAEVVAIYQRILTMRGKLASPSEVVWWQGPGKLALFYLFSEFSEKRGAVSASLAANFGRCPLLFENIKKLHGAAAFKAFQDPEFWLAGTPLAKSFNGSSTASQLRKWMQLGWGWSS